MISKKRPERTPRPEVSPTISQIRLKEILRRWSRRIVDGNGKEGWSGSMKSGIILGEWVIRSHDTKEAESARPSIAGPGGGVYRPTRPSDWHESCDQNRYYKDAYALPEIYKVGSFLETQTTDCSPSTFIFIGFTFLKITLGTVQCNHNPNQSRDYQYSFCVTVSTWRERDAAIQERRRSKQAQKAPEGKGDGETLSTARESGSETTLVVPDSSADSMPNESIHTPVPPASYSGSTQNGSIGSGSSRRSILSTLSRRLSVSNRLSRKSDSWSASTLGPAVEGSVDNSEGTEDHSSSDVQSGCSSEVGLEPKVERKHRFWRRRKRM